MSRLLIISMLATAALGAASVNYSYDSAGRLVMIDYGAGGSITYTYDPAGNITSRVVQAGTSSSIITGAKLRSDLSTVDLFGTNLVPADVSALQITVDGKAVQVTATCNASTSKSCRSDQVTIRVPAGEGRGEIVLRNGRSEITYQLIRK